MFPHLSVGIIHFFLCPAPHRPTPTEIATVSNRSIFLVLAPHTGSVCNILQTCSSTFLSSTKSVTISPVVSQLPKFGHFLSAIHLLFCLLSFWLYVFLYLNHHFCKALREGRNKSMLLATIFLNYVWVGGTFSEQIPFHHWGICSLKC